MIDVEKLKQLITYDPDTGIFTWNESRRCVKKGALAGGEAPNPKGRIYIKICIERKKYQAHRLAFLYMEGECLDPSLDVDHINGNGVDNRWVNLRKVSRAENMKNTRLSTRNKSGICGVHFIKKKSKWGAQIRANNKSISLGEYVNKEDAAEARKKAEIEYGFHANHGQKRLQYLPMEYSNK